MDVNFSNPQFIPSLPRTWPPILTIEQTALILNVSKWTLRKWDNENKLKALRFGSRKDRRYKKEEVLNILNHGML